MNQKSEPKIVLTPEMKRVLGRRRLEVWALTSGVKIDNRTFTYKGNDCLYPIYGDRSEVVVVQKAAQMGLTIYMILKSNHQALFPASWGFDIPIKIGFYFPEGKGIGRIVKDRVIPMMKSSPELQPYANQLRQDIKQLGNSSIYYLYMGGKSTKDSVPLNSVFIDEVRLVDLNDVFQTNARLLHSKPFKYKTYVSTAGLPGCFAKNTKIIARYRPNRKVKQKPIEEFLREDLSQWEVLSLGESPKSPTRWRSIIAAESNGVRPVVDIVFEDGSTIRCTPDHQFARKIIEPEQEILWTPIGMMKEISTLCLEYKGNCRNLALLGDQRKKVVDIRPVFPSEEVFDIQVEGAPCFFLAENGCLVHNSDINALFLESDQKWFYTTCPACNHEQILALNFPDCVVVHPKHSKRKGQSYYQCEKCKGEIHESNVGRYIAHNPDHEISGYQISQLISNNNSPKQLLFEYEKTTNRKEFWNSILGLPYVDRENKPINEEDLIKNINVVWEWGDSFSDNYMGVDQMMGLNYCFVISKRDSLRRVVWFEIIEHPDPFQRTAQLMDEFNCKFCVCDAMPNANEALRFAQYFNKRVFLAYYKEIQEVVRWEDDPKHKKAQRRASEETRHKYRVTLDRYQSIDYTIKMIAEQRIEWPEPERLMQRCRSLSGGRLESFPIMRSHAYPHFCSAIRERVILEKETGKFRMRWNYTGSHDPHSLHALNYAIFASERRDTGFTFSF